MNLDWLNNLDLIKRIKERAPAENSLFLRLLWTAQTFTCFFLIALVDPNVAAINVIGVKIPLLFIYFWTAVIGSYLSYHYRNEVVKWLEYVGLITIAITCTWFIDTMRAQLMAYTGEVDLLLPTLHLFAGLYVSHSFELRSRFDFNFSQGVSLLIVCFAGALGKGGLFGMGLLLYLVLAAIMLLLDCESRTFGQVQERRIDGSGAFGASSGAKVSEKTANLVFPTAVLVLLSIGLFLVIPRAESFVDVITAQFYSMIKHEGMNIPSEKHFNAPKRTRSPFHVKKPGEVSKKHNELDPKSNEKKDENEKSESSSTDGTGAKNGKGKTVKAGTGVPERGVNFSRTAEKKKQEKERKRIEQVNNSLQSNNWSRDNQADDRNIERSPDAAQSNSSAAEKNRQAQQNAKGKNRGNGSAPNGNKDKSSGAGKADGTGEQKKSPEGSNGGLNSSSQTSDKPKAKESAEGSSFPKDSENKGGAEGKGNSETENSDGKSKTTKNKKGNSKEEGNESDENNGKKITGGKKGSSKSGSSKSGEAEARPPMYFMPDTMDSTQAADQEDIVLFSVACNRTMFFRQGAFDHYDGRNWSISEEVSKAKLLRSGNGTFMLNEVNPLSLSAEIPAIKVNQKFRMMKNMGAKLIFAGYPSVINYPCSGLTIDSCGNLKGSGNLIENLEYSVTSDDPLFDLKKMIEEPVPSDEQEKTIRTNLAMFLQLPENHSDEFYELSRSIAGLDDNWFLQAHKITNYLKKNYKYSNDPALKKKSSNTAESFVFDTKTGDCKDFASAAVMLCRASGIPSRLAVGFTPGDYDSISGTRQVKLKNAHAWAEVYCPGAGWVPFDATPVSEMPARAGEGERIFSSLTQQMSGTEIVQGKDQNPGALTIKLPVPIGDTKTISLTWIDLIKLIPVVLFVIILPGPLMLMTKSLFSKKLSIFRQMHPASKIYCGMQKDLKKIGLTNEESQTPGEFLQRLEAAVDAWDDKTKSKALVDAVGDFVTSYNETFFGGVGSTKDLQKKREQIKGLLK